MYDDLDRPPLRSSRLSRTLAPEGWRIEVLSETGSTNAVVAQRARDGEPAGLVVVAETQTAGRGRLDRSWVSPPRSGLTFSVLLSPDLAPARWGWLPLWAGTAVALALREQTGLEVGLKWPNDVLVGGRKLGGLLAEVPVPGALVLGIGINVTNRGEELPHDRATSLQVEGASSTDRETLLKSVLRRLADQLSARDPDGYRRLCLTLGQQVRVELPDGRSVEGRATSVDDAGRLVVDGVAFAAGDVVHLRA